VGESAERIAAYTESGNFDVTYLHLVHASILSCVVSRR
jgi:hypothetical protein